MITAIHTLIYSDDPEATRAFLRDVLGWPSVESEPGWPIFRTGASELGVHPTEGEGFTTARHHEIAVMCDDVAVTRTELEARGATFSTPISDRGFGLVTMMEVPGADPILLYEPRHAVAYDL
jgi:catechol 2,3-dioxygenase-like lactoylglutathione lyase family enzyme